MQVRAILLDYEGMWQGAEHWIDLEEDARQVRLPPHRAGQNIAREVEKANVDEMLRLDVIEPGAKEWSSPEFIVLSQ